MIDLNEFEQADSAETFGATIDGCAAINLVGGVSDADSGIDWST
jgi:hypothetical protein